MPLAESVGAELVAPCDVTDDAQIEALFAEVDRAWGGLDILIHAVAFASATICPGSFVDTSRAGQLASSSAYSLVALVRAALPRMQAHGGTVLT